MSTAAFLTPLVINTVIAVVATAVFCFLRPKHPIIYEPRVYMLEKNTVQSVPKGVLDWVKVVLNTSDDTFYEKAGLDALSYTLFFRTAFKLFLIILPLALIVLLPVHATGDNGQSGLDQTLLSNVQEKSHRMWAHIILAYVFSLVALHLLREALGTWRHYRVRFMTQAQPFNLSTLVMDVPEHRRDPKKVLDRFHAMYPNISETMLARDTSKLEKAVTERNQVCYSAGRNPTSLPCPLNKNRLCLGGGFFFLFSSSFAT
eukprot:m.219543 g.219543  ORF g.219543 m.219543 type:complete len:259 (+) comp22265_c1_seq2:194-970(+)